jgi:hypothetical protein
MVKLLGKKDYTIEDLEKILDVSIEDDLIENTMLELVSLTDDYMSEHNVIFRSVSVSKEFVSHILERVTLGKQHTRTGTGIWSSKKTRIGLR